MRPMDAGRRAVPGGRVRRPSNATTSSCEVRIVVLGYGIRGRIYAGYAFAHADKWSVAAIADPLFAAGALAAPPGCAVFHDWREALEKADADAAIIALPDRLHCEAAQAALARGLHILLEKPLGCSWEECTRLRDAQHAAGRLVLTGYVLRFAAFYRRLRAVLRTGEIGSLVAINHLVEIGYGKAAHAFCRGNWGREEAGTSTLVQKCTHDFDLIAWWTLGRRPSKISSFGSLAHWKPENAPAGAAPRCLDCAASTRAACPFDAVKLYLDDDSLRYHFAERTDEAMRRVVESSPYGRCVYHCGNDAVNRQTVVMEYPDGLLVTLGMQAFTAKRRRLTSFYGTRGEIFADGTRIVVSPFGGAPREIVPEQHGAHGGGDREIMEEFARLVEKASPARYAAILDAALESHYAAFKAEEARCFCRGAGACAGRQA